MHSTRKARAGLLVLGLTGLAAGAALGTPDLPAAGAVAGGEAFARGAPAGPASLDTLRILEEETLLAAVVQTAGIASRFAPDHLIHATRYDAVLELEPDRLEETTFRARVWVPELGVNDPALQERVEGRLLELGVLDDPYERVSDEDREEIWTSMIGPEQLHAAEYPWIEVETAGIREEGSGEFSWVVTTVLTVRGARVEEPARASLRREGDRLRIEAYAAFRFTDLGIEPYSAYLGTVRNRDTFHLYLDLTAELPAS